MDIFKTILENELAVRTFDYPEDEGEAAPHRQNASERILHFGTSRHPGTGNMLVYGIDLNTLSPEDISILMNPEYLDYAWEVKDPIKRRDRLINIINREEGNLEPKGGAEEVDGGPGYKLVFGRGPAEYHEKRKVMTSTGEETIDDPHFSRTSSWKSYYLGDVDAREIIMLDLKDFRKVLNKLDEVEDDYTFANLNDNYLRSVSETDEAKSISGDDITHEEVPDEIDPDFVDEEPIEPDDIEKADAKEVEPEVDVDVKFEPDDLETGKVETDFEPEPEVTARERPDIDEKPKFEKPKKAEKTKLTPDIEKAIDKRIEQEIEKLKEPEPVEEPEEESEEEPEPVEEGLKPVDPIIESVTSAWKEAGLWG